MCVCIYVIYTYVYIYMYMYVYIGLTRTLLTFLTFSKLVHYQPYTLLTL